MAIWAWFAISVGTGALVGFEVWAWLRHGTSAIVIAVTGGFLLVQGLIVASIVAGIALGLLAGVTGWDPVGLTDDAGNGAAVEGRRDCDPGYPDVCLDPDASDYDCDGGTGNGPRYVSGPITVTGSDPYELDRDGDGIGCDS